MTLDAAITHGLRRCAAHDEDGGHGARSVALAWSQDRCVVVEAHEAGPVVRLVHVRVDGDVTPAEADAAGLARDGDGWRPTRARALRMAAP